MDAIAAHLPVVQRGEAAFQALRRQRRNATLLGLGLLAALLLLAARISEFHPATLAAGLPRIGEYFQRILPSLQWSALLAGPDTEGSIAFWFYRLDSWLLLLAQTAQMAALATLSGAAVALLLAFPAARNLGAGRWLSPLTRRALEATRTVPEIVYALIFVWAFGVGPLAGILAIAIHTAGALGKLFAEVIENAEMQAWDGMRASGANWAQACRYAILPQVAPNLLSYALLRFEINVRGASVIGFVGAGGIGQELYQVIAFNYYEEISAIVLLVILAVMLIDLVSERLRHRLIHVAGGR
ncbi:phosphonate ABC transporter, permease protein PhnE [Pseudoroseomonas rhizosphaerae]|uniref:Phosphonate ABC transporter, permease protein PhnE n=1 Tax=Teichococcus rhizosphaerae TaxID=1335062 RepID=A0A2C6Y262_9PROT|nr:phosphonate ABC transporter, permease protein PhnE [Pseudoroseomonas rhizosphaerae]PHK94872.1 phosphonate ABC transporter, permease protein PhnE [Pseudoroseomonas rhizosphaerae]